MCGGRQTWRPDQEMEKNVANETSLTVVGNLTADPDLRYTAAGVARAKFTVASTPRVFDRASGEYKDGDPLFLTCTAWPVLSYHAREALHQGPPVLRTSSLQPT